MAQTWRQHCTWLSLKRQAPRSSLAGLGDGFFTFLTDEGFVKTERAGQSRPRSLLLIGIGRSPTTNKSSISFGELILIKKECI